MYPSRVKINILFFLLCTPLISFGMEISSPEQGARNLRKLYACTDPKEIKKILRTEYVPVVMLDITPLPGESKVTFNVISPYIPYFYYQVAQKEEIFNEEFISLEQKRFNEGFDLCQKERVRQLESRNFQVPHQFCITTRGQYQPLILASLFGNEHDVLKEIEKNINNKSKVEYLADLIFRAILLSVLYPYKDKKILGVLLIELKKIQAYSHYTIPTRELSAYSLLYYSAKVLKDFKIIVNKDPYGMNNIACKIIDEKCDKTNLDRMFENPNFTAEHIKILRNNGALTVQELCDVNLENTSGEWD